MINIAQVGYGYWGPNLLRNLMDHPDANVKGVIDKDLKIKEKLSEKYPSLSFESDFSIDLLDEWEVDAVVIATPAETHFDIAIKTLKNNRHCLIEKPLTTTPETSRELIEIAEKNNLILMVGHTFLYNAAVIKMKEIIDSGELGEIYYVFAQRLNLGKIRQDVDVLWNLAPHDISIINYWFGELPVQVSARGIDFIQPNISDIAFVNLEFPGGKYAVIHLSWLDPLKIRQITVVGSKKMAVYNDTAEEKLIVYDKGVDRKHPEKATLGEFNDFDEFKLILRAGGIEKPIVNFVEPLQVEISLVKKSPYKAFAYSIIPGQGQRYSSDIANPGRQKTGLYLNIGGALAILATGYAWYEYDNALKDYESMKSLYGQQNQMSAINLYRTNSQNANSQMQNQQLTSTLKIQNQKLTKVAKIVLRILKKDWGLILKQKWTQNMNGKIVKYFSKRMMMKMKMMIEYEIKLISYI